MITFKTHGLICFLNITMHGPAWLEKNLNSDLINKVKLVLGLVFSFKHSSCAEFSVIKAKYASNSHIDITFSRKGRFVIYVYMLAFRLRLHLPKGSACPFLSGTVNTPTTLWPSFLSLL